MAWSHILDNDLIGELEKGDWQLTTGSPPDEFWDVLIVGAGPAGSIAAICLASRGHRVLLMDKCRFPREKVCGDALISDSIRCLQRVELFESVRGLGHEASLGTVFSPSRLEFEIPGTFVILKRLLLDALIARRAVEKGAVFYQGEVTRVSVEPDGTLTFRISQDDKPRRARIGVIATGVQVDLLKPHGMVLEQGPSAVAMRCYVRSDFELERLVISYDRTIVPGYAWIFPMGNGEYNIGCGISRRHKRKKYPSLRKVFQTFTSEFPTARKLLQHAKATSPLKGAPLRYGLTSAKPLGLGSLLAIGETIGTTFPFTGEGIGKAMESGELAAAVIHDALSSGDFTRLADYPVRLKKELKPRYLGYKVAEFWFRWPWLGDFMAHRVQKSKFMRESLAGILTETVDPRVIFSVKGVLKSFFC